MRAVVQRVSEASVAVDGKVVARIGAGLLVLLGVGQDDGEADADHLADKLSHLRVFPDEGGVMNRSVLQSGGELLVVSQFTLYGDCRKGRRPSYVAAAPPEPARRLYGRVCARLEEAGLPVARGVFQAMMNVSLVNQGPVTLLLDSRKTF